jgi:hypothetical protein
MAMKLLCNIQGHVLYLLHSQEAATTHEQTWNKELKEGK